MAPQASDFADKSEQPAVRSRREGWQLKGLCVVLRAEWTEDLRFDRQEYEDIAWIEMSCLSPLCLLACSLPFALSFPPVELFKGLAEISQWSETPSVPHCEQALASLPHTLWLLRCTMRCPMILSLIGELSARASRVPWRRANERAGLYTKWNVEYGVGVHQDADFSSLGSLEMTCSTVLRIYSVFSSLGVRWEKVLWFSLWAEEHSAE